MMKRICWLPSYCSRSLVVWRLMQKSIVVDFYSCLKEWRYKLGYILRLLRYLEKMFHFLLNKETWLGKLTLLNGFFLVVAVSSPFTVKQKRFKGIETMYCWHVNSSTQIRVYPRFPNDEFSQRTINPVHIGVSSTILSILIERRRTTGTILVNEQVRH